MGGGIPGLVALGSIRKQAKQAMRASQCVGIAASNSQLLLNEMKRLIRIQMSRLSQVVQPVRVTGMFNT